MASIRRCFFACVDIQFLFHRRIVTVILLVLGCMVPVSTYWFVYRQELFRSGYNVIQTGLHDTIQDITTVVNVTVKGWKVDLVTEEQPMCEPQVDDAVRKLLMDDYDNDTLWNSTDYLSSMRTGGWWEPVECVPRQFVVVIIPFRDRLKHLYILLRRLHTVLQRQQLAYRVYVAEQANEVLFNKGRVMNIAFSYVQEQHPEFNCTVFHDVDMIPETESNLYMCGQQPRHLSPAVNEMNYTLPYGELIGGVLAIRSEHFVQVNGYSNMYWGWGGEDDDMYYRMEAESLKVERPSNEIGRYTMLVHQKQPATPGKIRFKLVWSAKRRYKQDGLAQLRTLNYSMVSIDPYPTYTRLLINVGRRL